MIEQLPRIAIPEPTSTDEAYNQRSLPQYVCAVEAAGGKAVPIPLHAPAEAQAEMLASCSAILLPGSPADVDPTRYGQQAIQECAAKDVAREAADDLLLRDAFEQGKPILGICYGLQSLNVWRNGSLIQDLPHASGAKAGSSTTAGTIVNHQPGREVQEAHPVLISPGSRLASVLPETRQIDEPTNLLVNSSHHQAIDRPGDALRVAATSPLDGVIEALEGDDAHQFVVAVQWHPERSYESSEASRALFASFLEAARVWAAPVTPVSSRA
jgi:putative glutamine amidotransferase